MRTSRHCPYSLLCDKLHESTESGFHSASVECPLLFVKWLLYVARLSRLQKDLHPECRDWRQRGFELPALPVLSLREHSGNRSPKRKPPLTEAWPSRKFGLQL